MNLFIVTTYNISNLFISLTSIKLYHKRTLNSDIAVLINNDNPNTPVTKEYARFILGDDIPLYIYNTEKNRGCFGNRIVSIYNAAQLKPKHIFFLDDDDVVLSPRFDFDKLQSVGHGLLTKRLKEQLDLLVNPFPNMNNPYYELEERKLGNVGVAIKFDEYYKFIQNLKGFLPQIYEIYGSEKIFEPDDVIFMNLWYEWIFYNFCPDKCTVGGHTLEDVVYLWDNYFDTPDIYTYSLTLIEDRRGRYENIDPTVCDLRYGKEWDGKTTYANIIIPMVNAYYNYLRQK